jgi:hypothetical protein
MNVRQIANGFTSAINPNVLGSVYVSTGSAKAADFSVQPTYAITPDVPLQVQPLSGKDLKQLDSLNIQGVERVIFVNGNVEGLNRADNKGGDKIVFSPAASVPANLRGTTWLVKAVLATWDASGWCKVGVTRQIDARVTS